MKTSRTVLSCRGVLIISSIQLCFGWSSQADNSVSAWGSNGFGQTNVPQDLTNVVAISAGAIHNLALRRDGTVAAWGHNFYGQSTVPSGLSNVIAISGGFGHSLALMADA